MALNLESARKRLEKEMTDSIRITRPPRHVSKVFNRETGQYTEDVELGAGGPTIYGPTIGPDFGKCMVSNWRNEQRIQREGGFDVGENYYTFRIPRSFLTEIERYDLITVMTSLRDPQMPGKQYIVQLPFYSTFTVTRVILAEIRQQNLEP